MKPHVLTGRCERTACQARRLDLIETGDPQRYHDTAAALEMVGHSDHPPDLAVAFTYSTRAAADGFAELNESHNTPNLGIVPFPGTSRWLAVLDLAPQTAAIMNRADGSVRRPPPILRQLPGQG